MIEIRVSNLGEPEYTTLSLRWRKRDGLLYTSSTMLNGRAGPEQLVFALRELADNIERENNR